MKKPFTIFGAEEACVRVLGLSLIEMFNLSDPAFFIYKIGRKCRIHRFVVRTELKLSRASSKAGGIIFLICKEKCIWAKVPLCYSDCIKKKNTCLSTVELYSAW